MECKTNYKTECNIEKKIQPIPIKLRLCRSVASKECGTGEDNIKKNGEIACTTIYESGKFFGIVLKICVVFRFLHIKYITMQLFEFFHFIL